MASSTRPSAVAEGDRSVAVAGSPHNALIITGDRNTVEMRLEGVGAILAFAFRWDRPRRRRRNRRHACPPRFPHHVDRDDEVRTVLGNSGAPRVVNIHGEPGVGKTHVLVEALNRRESRMRHGTMYLDGRDQAADDLLHAVFNEFYECRVPRRDLRIERLLASRRGVVALEDVELEPDGAQRLVLGTPRCRLLVTSRRRVVFDGTPLKLTGLAVEHAAAIAEEELGRPLTAAEHEAVEFIAGAVGGHPLRLRQTFSRAREEGAGRPLDEFASALLVEASSPDELATLTPGQRQVARTLAVHSTAPVGLEHLRVLAGEDAASRAAELELRHDVISHSPRFSLTDPLATALADANLDAEIDRALSHFTRWAEARRDDPEAVLRESGALLALLERAQAGRRSAQVIRLGQAVNDAYVWGHRWAAWGRLLAFVLAAARHSGDRKAEGWALHQLGTRAYGLGSTPEASARLHEALELRELIGDDGGAAATRQNLRVVLGRASLLQRLSHLSLAVVAIIAVILIAAGGAGGAALLGDGDDRVPPQSGESARLAIIVDGDGSGVVRSADRAISCRTRCGNDLVLGTNVVLRARAESGSRFSRWRGATCSGTGACRFRLRADARVVAEFSRLRDPRELRVTVNGKGNVSGPGGIHCPPACRAEFEHGETVPLTANERGGASFAGWSGDCTGTARCELRLDVSRSVHAEFVSDPDGGSSDSYTLTVKREGEGSGTVTSDRSGIDCGGTCEASFSQGTVELSATADDESEFIGWSAEVCSDTDTCTVTLDRPRTVKAQFEPKAQPPVERSR